MYEGSGPSAGASYIYERTLVDYGGGVMLPSWQLMSAASHVRPLQLEFDDQNRALILAFGSDSGVGLSVLRAPKGALSVTGLGHPGPGVDESRLAVYAGHVPAVAGFTQTGPSSWDIAIDLQNAL